MSEIPVIAVDGPSGTGKGTVSARLADWLGWQLLDSGALYRLVALMAERDGIDARDETAMGRIAVNLDLDFARGHDPETPIRVLLAGEDVTAAIRSERVSRLASEVAASPAVRSALLERQRACRRPPGLIADGRDMGTVVFPDAQLKFFLTASPEERARRRYKQLKQKGIGVSLPHLSADIAERDARDSQRKISPLRPAPDACVIDTTDLDVDSVMEIIRARITEYFSGLPASPASS